MEGDNFQRRTTTVQELQRFTGKLGDCRPVWASLTGNRHGMWRGKSGRMVPVVHRAQAVWMRNMARLDEAEAAVSQARTRIVNGVRVSA